MATEQTSDNTTQNASTPTSTGTASPGSTEAKFTQADIDRIVGERAKHAKSAAVTDLLQQLGLASEDDLKTTITKAREAEAATLSATEKAQKDLDAEKKRAETLQQQLEAERTKNRTILINAGLREAAKAAPDTDLVLLYARTYHADGVNALLKDDGTLDQDKAKALIEAVKKEKPLLFSPGGSGTPGSPSANGKAAPADAKVKEQASRDTRRHTKSNF